MKTNITIDNYEAYLLDYMEGNLGPDEAEQLKAFVAAQGLDWNELTEELPHLEAPQIEFEDKERLKKKGALVPLYVKIASAAAAAGLLLTVTLWPDKSMPKVEPIATLKPIEVEQRTMPNKATMRHATNTKEHSVPARETTPLLAQLPVRTTTAIEANLPWTDFDEPYFDMIAYRMNNELTMTQLNKSTFPDDAENEQGLSLIGRGIYRLTNGRHDSFASIISTGLSTAKKEIALAATDAALTAYYRADEHFEEAKENWQNKREE